MSLPQLQSYAFTTKYARWSPELGRRETYEEAVNRVFDMHAKKYADKDVAADIEFARQAGLERLVLGSQRALQFGGVPIERVNARIYNCTVSYCDRPRFFQEALWMLLCGSGVGFSVQAHHIAKLPMIASPRGESVTYLIPDSIEGWADALGVLLSTYFVTDQPFPEFAGKQVTLDYSQIRPLGASISSGSGKAPGPEPLKRAIERIRLLLDALLVDAGSPCQLRPIQCYDILMHASDAVLSGGVRRSATICLFSPTDQEMVTAKTGDWFVKNPQRGRSNNSAVLLRDSTSFEDFNALMSSVRQCGEPGFVWTDSTEVLVNPCCEISMWAVDEVTGESGWAMCNLCEINMKLCTSVAQFARAAKAAAILGTLQAGYTDFGYLGPVSERIVRREALLGCSMTGIMDNPRLALDPDLQREMATLIVHENERMAAKLGINPSARSTCVKPAGTTSCILGTSSGIHPHHAKRYFRRVQANQAELPYQYFSLHNPLAVEPSVWSPNKDAVVTFCVTVPEEARTMNEVSALDLLKIVRSTQENWVMPGKVQARCTQPWLQHNVSNTITIRDHEWDDVARYIYDHRQSFTGVSLLPMGGDLDYPQAPFCAVWTHEEILKEYGVGALFASGLIVDGLHAFGDLWVACSCALGTGESLDLQAYTAGQDLEKLRAVIKALLSKKDWVRRAAQFANRYFAGDLKRMSYCLKRVSLCKLWEDLQREGVPVDYRLMPETTDGTKLAEAQACAGGKCDL
jgi:ribonucleoside-triphosphate reductase